jgi:hypothetical protein
MIEFQDFLNVTEQRIFCVFPARPLRTRQQCFHANFGMVEEFDELHKLAFLGILTSFGNGDVHFVDVFGFAERKQGLSGTWLLPYGRTFPNSQPVDKAVGRTRRG